MTKIKSLAASRVSHSALLTITLLAGSLSAPATVQAQAAGVPQQLTVVQLNAGIHNISAMVARTTEERSIGLMFRSEMGASEGMLFVFDKPAQQCFWMRNTPLPLSAAFVADDGSIVNIEDMKPQTLDSHCSTKPVRFVLEMHQGWFAKRGIKPGSKISGPPFNRQ